MNEVITIHYRWTTEELLNGYRWHFRHRVPPIFRWALWLLEAVFSIVGAFQVWESRSLFPGGLLLIVGIYIPLTFLVVRPWLVRRQFAKRPDRDTEIEWRVSADSIHARGEHGTSDFTWLALSKVVETPAGFLFYPTQQIFHWLPRHGFASDTDFNRLSEIAQQQAAKFHRSA